MEKKHFVEINDGPEKKKIAPSCTYFLFFFFFAFSTGLVCNYVIDQFHTFISRRLHMWYQLTSLVNVLTIRFYGLRRKAGSIGRSLQVGTRARF